jgi:DNA-binding transcriptional LysR family regulator
MADKRITIENDSNDRVKALRRIDLNLFVVFATIYEYRSLTISAHHLGVTQPAVSHSLARLRDALNDKLFVRKGSQSIPTPFAQSIIDDVRTSLDLIRSGPLGLKEFHPETASAEFRISMDAATEALVLPELVQRINRMAPGIVLSSMRVQRKSVEAELGRGDLDLAIDVDFPFGNEIKRHSVVRDRPVVVGRRNGNRSSTLTQEEYLRSKHIVVTSRRGGIGLDDYVLAKLGFRRDIAVRCSSLMVGLQIAENTDNLLSLGLGQLLGISPEHELQVFDFPFEVPDVESLLFWHENFDTEPSNMWLRKQVADVLELRHPSFDCRRHQGARLK